MNYTLNLVPRQACEMIGVCSSTLRLWSVLFRDSLSKYAAPPGKGRQRSYTPDDILVLSRVKYMLKQFHTVDEIKEAIGKKDIEKLEDNPQALACLPEIYSVRIDEVTADDLSEQGNLKNGNRKIRFSTLARSHVAYEIKQGFSSELYMPMTFDQWKDTLLFFDCVCAYCGGRAKVFEHFVPARKGGRFVYGNILPACNQCNTKKGYREPYGWMIKNCEPEYVSRIIEFISASLFVRSGGCLSIETRLHSIGLDRDSSESPATIIV